MYLKAEYLYTECLASEVYKSVMQISRAKKFLHDSWWTWPMLNSIQRNQDAKLL